MSEAAEAQAAEELGIDTPAVVTPGDDDTAQADPNEAIELEALAMGWKPRDGFKGDESKFVDAAEYVRRGKEIMPFLRKELATSTAKISKLEKTLERFAEHHSKTEMRAYEKARRDLEAELDQAATAGDAETVRAVTKDIVELEKEVAGKPAAQPSANDDFTAWKDDSPWYGTDKALSAAFDALCEEVAGEGYSTPKVGLKEAERRLREQFPAKFAKPENPNRRQAAAVEGVGAGSRPRGKSYADLPADAKAACDDFVKRVPGFTRERYVKDFFQ